MHPSPSGFATLLPIVMLCIGGVILVLVSTYFRKSFIARKHWTKTTGVVLGAGNSIDDGAAIWFGYDALDPLTGERLSFSEQSAFTLDLGIYPRDKRVPLYYDPSNPKRFHAHVFAIEPFLIGGLGLMGLAMVCFATYFTLFR